MLVQLHVSLEENCDLIKNVLQQFMNTGESSIFARTNSALLQAASDVSTCTPEEDPHGSRNVSRLSLRARAHTATNARRMRQKTDQCNVSQCEASV